MTPWEEFVLQSRRSFLTSTAGGIGLLALASMLRDDRLLAEEAYLDRRINPLAPRPGHFPGKAKNCICIYLEGAPSQLDLFDPKPKLNELHGQKLPESLIKNVRFAFIQKDTATLMGSPRKFQKHGQCGMELSDFLPHLATCVDDICLIRSMYTEAFNHHPGQLLMNTGSTQFGRPSIGSWLVYGLGSESRNLPGYVVLTAGRGTSGGTSNWSSGFLPTTYAGVLFRNQGEPVLNLNNPPGVTRSMQEKTIAALRDLNQLHGQVARDPEIQSRIAAYELAFRMQAAAPELLDFSNETKETLEMYGLFRNDDGTSSRGGGRGVFHAFALNCLLARRLIERGVRFVSIFHASWDHHSNLDKELAFNCKMADQPIAALLKDLKRRGLLDSTLVMWLSEFGRTPLGENRPGFTSVSGRDHHPFAFSIWLAGGGIKGGQVIGKTDEIGWGIVEDPIHIHDLHATILYLFGFDHTKLTYRFQGRDFRLTDIGGKVITKMLA
ncbi:MAG: DUF1501 domain-containing protein [Gemmatales bacterium]|nr:DUF1501 domain-containing protein [Gemmatales bacterium]MDW7994737.1 DUF1501 domain-containing protein [Gemmatales bacterium]